MSASLFLAGCETEVKVPYPVEVPMLVVPDNAIPAATKSALRILLASDITLPIDYRGVAPTVELVISMGKTVYLSNSGGIALTTGHLVVEPDAVLVIVTDFETATSTGNLLVKGTVKVGPGGTFANGAAATEVGDYTTNPIAPKSPPATVIGTDKVQVLKYGTLELKAVDVVTLTLAKAWNAAGEGSLDIDGATTFTVDELAGKASGTCGIRAETSDDTTALPAVIPQTAQITASGTIISVEGKVLTVNGITFPAATTVQGTAIAANALTIGSLTVPAKVAFTVGKQKTLTINGTLAFTNNTSTVIIQAEGSLTAGATSVIASKAGDTTDGSGVALTVGATADPGTATSYTSNDTTAPAAVTLTTASAAAGAGSAYVIGNASFAVNNLDTAHAATAETSIAAGSDAAAGTITAAADSVIVLVGKS